MLPDLYDWRNELHCWILCESLDQKGVDVKVCRHEHSTRSLNSQPTLVPSFGQNHHSALIDS
jgi:hypothetical protein